GSSTMMVYFFFFFQAEDGIRDRTVTGVQTCALPISVRRVVGAGIGSGRARLDVDAEIGLLEVICGVARRGLGGRAEVAGEASDGRLARADARGVRHRLVVVEDDPELHDPEQ